MHDLWRCPWLPSGAAWACIPSPVVFLPDLVQGCSVENAEARVRTLWLQGVSWLCFYRRSGLSLWHSSSRPCLPQIQLWTEVWSGWSWGALSQERNRWVLLWVLRMAVTAPTRNTPQAHPDWLCVSIKSSVTTCLWRLSMKPLNTHAVLPCRFADSG